MTPIVTLLPQLRVLAAIRQLSTTRPAVVLIDGGSGSGKSTLADAVHNEWPGSQLVRLENIYPGWDGLEAASAQLQHFVLEPFAHGLPARWREWDWAADAPAGWHPVDSAAPLLIEGSGALSRANRALAHLGIWVECAAGAGERYRRAMARDDEQHAAHWERWDRQETAFAVREHPSEIADLIVVT